MDGILPGERMDGILPGEPPGGVGEDLRIRLTVESTERMALPCWRSRTTPFLARTHETFSSHARKRRRRGLIFDLTFMSTMINVLASFFTGIIEKEGTRLRDAFQQNECMKRIEFAERTTILLSLFCWL